MKVRVGDLGAGRRKHTIDYKEVKVLILEEHCYDHPMLGLCSKLIGSKT